MCKCIALGNFYSISNGEHMCSACYEREIIKIMERTNVFYAKVGKELFQQVLNDVEVINGW